MQLVRVMMVSDWIATLQYGLRQHQDLTAKPFHLTGEKEFTEAAAKLRDHSPSPTVALVDPSLFWITWQAAARADAYRGLWHVGVAMAKYRAAKGEYPKALDDLVPAYIDFVPFDPFDGTPLKMRREKDAIVLHSAGRALGPNGKVDVEIKLSLALTRPQ